MKTDNPLDRYLSGIDIDRVKEKTRGTGLELGEVLDSLGIPYYDLMVVYEQLSDRQWGLCPDCEWWEGAIGDKFASCLCGVDGVGEWAGWEFLIP
jgi:hypothetical protein